MSKPLFNKHLQRTFIGKTNSVPAEYFADTVGVLAVLKYRENRARERQLEKEAKNHARH